MFQRIQSLNIYLLLFGVFSFILLTNVNANVIAQNRAPITYAELEGTINPGSSAFLKEAIETSQTMGAQAFILRLDTPGGLLSSTRDIVRYFSTAKIPIILFVSPGGARATSAGAIIAVSSHFSAMTSGTNIGAATPVNQDGKNIEGDLEKKAKQDTAALVRAQAELRGRSGQVAEKMVLEAISFSSTEAVKQGVVDIEVNTLADLLKAVNGREFKVGEQGEKVTLVTTDLLEKDLKHLEMSPGQKFLHFIANPNISTLLMAAAGVAIYAEISSGFALIFPGTIGLFLLILAFVSLQTLPVNIGGIILLALGVVLFIAEAFITSFGFLAVGGIVSIGIGALFLVDTNFADIQVSFYLLVPILAALSFVMGLIAWLVAREKFVESKDRVDGAPATVLTVEQGGLSGTALVAGEYWSFSSDTPLSIGDKSTVIGKSGLQLKLSKKEN
ncbi:MAG: nodulation protein NfeD [Bdellovibrionaceae bacterium]|nr:nodulation protein NfeD [Pseudobdellovibrionaceae bacterium]